MDYGVLSTNPNISNRDAVKLSRVEMFDRVAKKAHDRFGGTTIAEANNYLFIIAADLYGKCRYGMADGAMDLLAEQARNAKIVWRQGGSYSRWMLNLMLHAAELPAIDRDFILKHQTDILATVDLMIQGVDNDGGKRFNPVRELTRHPSEKDTVEFVEAIADQIRQMTDNGNWSQMRSEWNAFTRESKRRYDARKKAEDDRRLTEAEQATTEQNKEKAKAAGLTFEQWRAQQAELDRQQYEEAARARWLAFWRTIGGSAVPAMPPLPQGLYVVEEDGGRLLRVSDDHVKVLYAALPPAD